MPRKPSFITLSSIGENNLIRRISQWLGSAKSSAKKRPVWGAMEIIATIGDDTAIVRSAPAAPPMAITTDMLVEGVHFLHDHPPFELGQKSAAVNLSDLAAVGAWPAWVVVSIGLPPATPVDWIEAFYMGMNRMLGNYGCLCIGGDCVRSDKIVINIAAAGNCCPTSKIPLRSRLQPGQKVYVTGTLGDSGAGLHLLQHPRQLKKFSDSQMKDAKYLIARHQCPTPRIEAGVAIAEACPDAAMMDLSDGLASDLPRLALLGNCGMDIEAAKLPLSTHIQRLASLTGISATTFATASGEDYELVFATSVPFAEWKTGVAHAAGDRLLRITQIGSVTQGSEVCFLDKSGEEISAENMVFRHF